MDEELQEPLMIRFDQLEVDLLACESWAEGRALIQTTLGEHLNSLLDSINGVDEESGDPSVIATITTMFEQLVVGVMDEKPWAEYRDELIERMRQAVAQSRKVTYH